MHLFESFKKVFAGYFDFRGKSNAADFYLGLLSLLAVEVVWQLLRGAIFNADGADFETAFAKQQTVQLILNFALYLPMVALIARRLRDMGRTVLFAAPLAIIVLAINLDAAYAAWVNTAYATEIFADGGGWFSSLSSTLFAATILAWIFTFVVTINWAAAKTNNVVATVD